MSLKELLANEAELIEKYEQKIRAKKDKKEASSPTKQEMGQAKPILHAEKPVQKEWHYHHDMDYMHRPPARQDPHDIDYHFLQQPLSK